MGEVITVPEAARRLNVSRNVIERIIAQYGYRLPEFIRVGNARGWPADFIDTVRVILEEEERCQGGRP
jgi:predicted DNA-binding transcriptional regulator AlpA